MRRLVVGLLVLVALLAVLDRVALWAAQHDVAKRLQADASLPTTPSVEIHGYPFLNQMIGGTYDDVDVVMHGLDAGGMRVDKLSVHVNGAHVSIADVVSQNRSRIRIDHASATLLLTYGDLQRFLQSQAHGIPVPHLDHSAITGASVRGTDTVMLQLPVAALPVPLSGLPFGIHLTSAKATETGIEVTGAATGLVLRT